MTQLVEMRAATPPQTCLQIYRAVENGILSNYLPDSVVTPYWESFCMLREQQSWQEVRNGQTL